MTQVGTAVAHDWRGRWTRDQHIDIEVDYLVERNSSLDGPLLNMTALGIPDYGDPYSAVGNDGDPWLFAVEIAKTGHLVKDARFYWIVTVVFSTNWRKRKAQKRQNPIDDPHEISFSYVQFTKPVEKDKDDDPVVNTAGEPYSPAPEINDSRLSVRIVKNTANMDLDQWAAARDKVNSGAMWGLAARKVLLKRWDPTVEYYGKDNPFIRHVYEFEVNDDKWNTKLLEAGYRELVGGVLRTIEDHDHPRHRPTPLDANGEKLDPPITSANAVYTEWELYSEYDLTTLPGIPNPLPGPFV